jgi:hypothetical protein
MYEKIKSSIKYAFQAGIAPLSNSASPNGQFLSELFNPNTSLTAFFNAFFKTALVVGAMLAVLRIGYAGFIYMTTDSFGSKGNAKQIIQDAVLGLLLLLSVWLILYQINPNILNLDILQVPRSTPAGGQPLPGSTPIGSGGIGSQ